MTVRIDGTNTSAAPGITGADTDSGLQFETNECNFVGTGDTTFRIRTSGTTNSDDTFLKFKNSGNAASNYIFFGDSDDADAGRIRYQHSNDTMQFRAGAGERMRILSSGGITFNGDTAATNALDDYEEGTWVPVFDTSIATGSLTNLTYNSQEGRYIKVGKIVYVEGKLQTASVTNSTSGTYDISGLPFPIADTAAGAVFVCFLQQSWGDAPHFFSTVGNTDHIRARAGIAVGGASYVNGNSNNFNESNGNKNRVHFSGCYEAA